MLAHLLLHTCDVKLRLLFFNHDLVLSGEFVQLEIPLLHSDLQLFSIELVDMLEIDQLFELERIQQRMNLFDLPALELSDGKSIKLLDVKKLAGLGNLAIEFLNLLWESLFILFLLGCKLEGD
jgi:hypothetical protein